MYFFLLLCLHLCFSYRHTKTLKYIHLHVEMNVRSIRKTAAYLIIALFACIYIFPLFSDKDIFSLLISVFRNICITRINFLQKFHECKIILFFYHHSHKHFAINLRYVKPTIYEKIWTFEIIKFFAWHFLLVQ